MCQLTAIIPTRDLTEQEKRLQAFIMSELLLANSKAGNQDGVGIANTAQVFTWEQSGQIVVPSDGFNESLLELVGGTIIGHVRATSTGAKAKQGAHPFVEGHLILAHNGTFREYKKLKAFETFEEDDDPVDSHVVCREMKERVGDGELDENIIKEVIEEADGSYALLIIDARKEDLWVVRGSCSLSIGSIGPLKIINTSATNLDSVLKTSKMVARTVLGMTGIELKESTMVETRTINKVVDGNIEKVLDIPFQYKQSSYTKSHTSYNSSSWEKDCTTEEARRIADKMVTAYKQPGITPDVVEWGARYVFGKEWFELSVEEVDALVDSVLEIFEESYTPKKGQIWTEVWLNLSPRYPYEALDNKEIPVKFPFALHTEDELEYLVEKTSKEVV